MKRLFTLLIFFILSELNVDVKPTTKTKYNPVNGKWVTTQKFTRYTNGQVHEVTSTYEFLDDGKCLFTYDGDTVIPLKWEMVGWNHLRIYYSTSGFKEYRIAGITRTKMRLENRYINNHRHPITEVKMFTRVIN